MFFGFPGVVLITMTMKYVDTRLGKITDAAGAVAAVKTSDDN